MGLFDFFRQPDINAGVAQYQQTAGAVLLDVRTAEEYASGHIPGSLNLDVQNIRTTPDLIPNRGTPLFVYCRGGARSGSAVPQLQAASPPTAAPRSGDSTKAIIEAARRACPFRKQKTRSEQTVSFFRPALCKQSVNKAGPH